jgi:WD40 repeat protein
LTTQECVAVLTGHTDFVTSIAFGRGGKRLVSGSFDGTVKLWDVQAAINAQTGVKDKRAEKTDKQ